MLLARFMAVLVLAVVGAVATLPLTACSTSRTEAVTSAVLPLGSNLMADFDAYTDRETDLEVRQTNIAMAEDFRAAMRAGDAVSASTQWFGIGNIRSRLFVYWAADPKFSEVGGASLLEIKRHNAEALDYILSVGTPQ
jgi:hypothetical protein